MCLYAKVTELCEQKGVKISQMCNETGIPQNTVSNWKNRPDAVPSLSNALSMAKYFGIDPSNFERK